MISSWILAILKEKIYKYENENAVDAVAAINLKTF